MARAVPARQREFALGRACARIALQNLGYGPGEIPVRENRAPQWPQRIVGSITHTTDLAVAVVCSDDLLTAIGIDAERVGAVGEHLWPRLLTEGERRWVHELEPDKRRLAATLIFCAKESYYKCCSGFAGPAVGFQDAEIAVPSFAGESGEYRLRVLKGEAYYGWTQPLVGRYTVMHQTVIASLWISPEAPVRQPGREIT